MAQFVLSGGGNQRADVGSIFFKGIISTLFFLMDAIRIANWN